MTVPVRAGADPPGPPAQPPRLDLRAKMPLFCQIEVEPAPVAENLDLTKSEGNLLVALVQETCNSSLGYTVTVSSRGEGQLQPESGAGVTPPLLAPAIPYELRYGGERALLRGTALHPQPVSEMRGRTSAFGVRKALVISYRPVQDAPGGAYSDVLIFTITPR